MILLAIWAAQADPVAARTPTSSTWTVHAGLPEAGGAWRTPMGLRIGVGARTDLGSAEGAVVQTWTPTGASELTVDLDLGGGVQLALRRPGIALAGVAAVRGGFRGEHALAMVGVVCPLSVGVLGRPAVRVPVLAETWFGGGGERVFVVGRAAAGAVLSPGLPSFSAQVGLSVGLRRPE